MTPNFSASADAATDDARKLENLHILFWLLKDMSWCMVWRPLGIAMILPTLGISLLITWRSRHLAAELVHNVAITCWIIANSYWMLSEFFDFDTARVAFTDGKHLAIVPFAAGMAVLLYYYLVQKPHEQAAAQAELLVADAQPTATPLVDKLVTEILTADTEPYALA